MHLYELNDQLVAIDSILEQNTDAESQEILESARDQLLAAIDNKLDNILDYLSDCRGKIDQIKAEEERLAKKRKSLDKRVEYLKGLLMWHLKTNNLQKTEIGTWTVSLSKTPPRVVLDACDDEYPEKYKRISWDIDKILLKQDMIDGILTIDGKQLAHTEQSDSLRLK